MSNLTLHDWYIRFSLELEKFNDKREKADDDLRFHYQFMKDKIASRVEKAIQEALTDMRYFNRIANDLRCPEILKIEDEDIDEEFRGKLIERMNQEGSEGYKSIMFSISEQWTKDEEPEE